ncbi:MAG: hypothetical protein L0Y58_25190, partial [Verrucomicrobia subdivision 3 bacterium]|nr:hypothetical protein [Limisphaerales bacterium]
MKTSVMKPVCAALAGAALLSASPARADKQVSVAYTMPMHINAVVDADGCENSPGPQVTLGGEIILGGLDARIILSNNQKGTHTTTVVAQYDLTLLPDGGKIVIPKQPVLGGTGGNPHIYLQFHDGKGGDLSQEFYLGRCVQGLRISSDVINEAIARANVHTEGCSNHPGPYITLGGDLFLSGLHAKFIFRNNVKGTHTAEETRDITIIRD